MPAINGNILGLASRVFGQSVQGASQLPTGHRSGLSGAMDTFFSAADTVLNDGRKQQTSALLGTLRFAVGGMGNLLGAQTTTDPVGMTQSDQVRVQLLQAKSQTLGQRLKDAQARAAAGDPTAANDVKVLTVQAQQANVAYLGARAQASGTFVTQLTTDLTSHYANSAGWEQLDKDGVDFQKLLTDAKTPQQRAVLNDQLMVALGVSQARLDNLRAQIDYYEELNRTGQLAPDQQAQLESLRQRLSTSQDRYQQLQKLKDQFLAQNAQQLTQLKTAYQHEEQHFGKLVEAEERLSGKSLATGQAVDWGHMTDQQKQQELHGASDAIRTANTNVVEHHDYSTYDQLQQDNLQHWDAGVTQWQRDMDAADEQRREDQRRDDARYQQKRDDQRSEQQRLDEQRQQQGGSAADQAAQQVDAAQQQQAEIQQFVEPLRQEEDASYQAYLAALDQSHQQRAQLAAG